MNQVYEPLKDPSSDGFTFVGAEVDLEKAPEKLDWKEPLWAKFKAFWWGFGKAAMYIALFLIGVLLYQGYKDHDKTIQAIQYPPSGSPEIGKTVVKENAKKLTKPKAKESAPKNGATEATNTPPSAGLEDGKKPEPKAEKAPEIVPPVAIVKQPLSDRELAYEQRQINFDNRSSTIGVKP